MRKSGTVELDGIGSVLFEKSKRAKHLNISVRPLRGVRVAVPYGTTFEQAEEFVHSRTAWIQKHLGEVKEIEEAYKAMSESEDEINRVEARRVLVNRLERLSEQHGFCYNKVSIRNQKTRWGSCSANDDISLNMKLLKLPQELIDYVILHELVHTRIKNHTKAFWRELDRIIGDAKALDARLNDYRMALGI
ncbi:MAG: M48 family metallopeptidase [Deltaproteobacteria bacterium]|nr:M48 family metallopeptidase [Deltaproteobacteria bacterium]